MRGGWLSVIFAGVGVIGCDAGAPVPPVPPVPPATNMGSASVAAPVPPAPLAPRAPFAIGRTLVGEDGRVVKTFDALNDYAPAIPLGGDRYRMDGYRIDAAARTAELDEPPARKEYLPIGGADQHPAPIALARYADGRRFLDTSIAGPMSVRPPDVAWSGDRIAVADGSTVVGIDAATGKHVWSAKGTSPSRLHAAGDALFYIDCNAPTRDRWLYGYALADGAPRFRAELDFGCDPSLAIASGWVFVVDEYGHAPTTRAFDVHGHLRFRLPEILAGAVEDHGLGAYPIGDDVIAVTDQRIARLGADGTPRWQLGKPDATSSAEVDFARLPGGDLVIADWDAISDEGVEVQRVDPETGRVAWHARLLGLGVAHSEYWQSAYLLVRGDDLFVVSQGASGAFFERLSLATGRREQRCLEPEATCAAL